MIALWLTLFGSAALADPGGLVAPAELLGKYDSPVERTGVQRTWVFHRDGMQTIAIRPGFLADTPSFGMLVPLPSAPSVHPIPDELFEQLEAALAPPTVQVEVKLDTSPLDSAFRSRLPMVRSVNKPTHANGYAVLSKQAVGTYEVTLIEAASPAGLQEWMDASGFGYPEDMAPIVADYIDRGWVFAAVTANMNDTSAPVYLTRSSGRPAHLYTGFVQGLAFRFAIDEPVIPMRLSTAPLSEMHNRLFILSEAPVRVRELPTDLVRLQLTGEALQDALTEPLPLRLTGSEHTDRISEAQWQAIAAFQDQTNRTWAVRDRVRADSLAAQRGEIDLDREVFATDLANTSTALGLPGWGVTALERQVVQLRYGEGSDLDDLHGMYLTVLDGDFDIGVLRHRDLHLDPYELPDQHDLGAPWDAEPDIELEARVR